MIPKKKCSPDVMMEVLSLINRSVPVGVAVTDEDWNFAYDLFYVQSQLETIQWKLKHFMEAEL